jgi:hypothetical protein
MVTMLQGAKKKATKSGAYVGDVLYEMYKTRTEYTYTNITSSYLNPR